MFDICWLGQEMVKTKEERGDNSFQPAIVQLGGARRGILCFVVKHGCTVFPAKAQTIKGFAIAGLGCG